MVKYKSLRELHRLKHTLEESTMDKVKFLMSDTSAEVTAACREALELKGVEVTVVEKDGLKVLQKMLSVRPQVVLLDAFMPGLDALAVKQKYNAAGERHTAFFVTGAFQSEEMVQELLDEGFAYYFVKPFVELFITDKIGFFRIAEHRLTLQFILLCLRFFEIELLSINDNAHTTVLWLTFL